MQGSNRTSQERMVYVGIGLVFALLLAGYLVYKVAVVVLVMLLTILFSIIMSAPVDYLNRRGIGRGLGTLVVLGGFVLLFGIAGAALVPIIEDQASEFVDTFPALLENVQQLVVGLQSALGLKTSLSLRSEERRVGPRCPVWPPGWRSPASAATCCSSRRPACAARRASCSPASWAT